MTVSLCLQLTHDAPYYLRVRISKELYCPSSQTLRRNNNILTVHQGSLLARCEALRLHFAEHCSWEKALPKLKDADRLPDPSTVRRWSTGVEFPQPALSFLSQTVARVTHWLARGRQVLDQAGRCHG